MEMNIINYLMDKCELCGIRPKMYNDGRQQEDPKWCKRCDAMYQRKRSMSSCAFNSIALRNIGEKYMQADMEHIDEPVRGQLLTPHEDIYLWGTIGSGKTYAMAALFKYKIARGFDCQRINFDSFCCKVRSTMNRKAGSTEEDLIRELVDLDCLFIDDIGLRSKQETDFAFVTFYTILNKRQEKMLPTYITTNKSIGELAVAFDDRIASRLRTAIEIHLDGKDRRLG